MISENLRFLIESHYKIVNIGEISELKGGYWNQTFNLATDNCDYVLRISPARTPVKRNNIDGFYETPHKSSKVAT